MKKIQSIMYLAIYRRMYRAVCRARYWAMLATSFMFGLGGCATMDIMSHTDSEIESLVASVSSVLEIRQHAVLEEERASDLFELLKNKNRFDVAAVGVTIGIFLMSLVEESPYNMDGSSRSRRFS